MASYPIRNQRFGMWIANSKETAPILENSFLFGTLERVFSAILVSTTCWLSQLTILIGWYFTTYWLVPLKVLKYWVRPTWLAVTDLCKTLKVHPEQYKHLLELRHQPALKLVKMIGSFGILMGMVVAIYRNVDDDKKHQYKGMLTATGACKYSRQG